MLALDLVIVMPISWWPLISDYNRFAASPRASVVGTVAGYSSANAAFFILGGALVLFTYSFTPAALYHDFLFGLSLLQLGAFPLLIILVDETDNAFANVYSTAVSIQNFAPKWKQAKLVVAATALATAGALYLVFVNEGIGGTYNVFLILIGGVFVPLLGVVIADAFVVRRNGYRLEEFGEGASAVKWPAFAAWAPASLLYYAVFAGWIAGFPPIGATLPCFALAAGLHILLSRIRGRADGIAHEQPSERAG
jgi:purine-cytosine permease-like protein